jgi:hypothetical protein
MAPPRRPLPDDPDPVAGPLPEEVAPTMTADEPFSRPVPLRMDVPSTAIRLEADAAERAAVAGFLELDRVDRLAVDGHLERTGAGFLVQGIVHAEVLQTCVVTFDPVPARLSLPFRRMLRLGGGDPEPQEVDPLGEDVDELDAAAVDLGVLAVEELSLGLDPYPRSPDADAALARVERPDDGPFAVLAQRRTDA